MNILLSCYTKTLELCIYAKTQAGYGTGINHGNNTNFTWQTLEHCIYIKTQVGYGTGVNHGNGINFT